MSEEVADLSLEQLKRELVSLKRENNACFATIEKLLKDIHSKNEHIKHLESLLSKSVPVVQAPIPVDAPKISSEEEIAEIQLDKLNKLAKTRSLTLEEVRMYDLLVKNKRLSQEKTSNNQKGSFRDVSEVELIRIASKSHESDSN